jgi:hypothetical protein
MTLNFESPENKLKKKNNSKYKAALGVGSAVSLLGIGSTLAANITLSDDNTVEFGQGVVRTAACDQDGFTLTPYTSFDNEHSIFRVDYVQVSGVNLTPEGTGWDDPDHQSAYADQTAAKLAHPGQYYDGTDWKNTCDGVVLDFKAYTSDPTYAPYTDDAYYVDPTNTSLTSPVGWSQDFNYQSSELSYVENPGFAVVIDSTDNGSAYSVNWAINGVDKEDTHGYPGSTRLSYSHSGTWTSSNAKFDFYSYDKPNAASISKITVQSMNEFSDSYYAISVYDTPDYLDASLGNPSTGW